MVGLAAPIIRESPDEERLQVEADALVDAREAANVSGLGDLRERDVEPCSAPPADLEPSLENALDVESPRAEPWLEVQGL
ncbi:MAG: hypothetical protein HYR85_21255 [Planctomycetes bacterium]|nr:hypothetical protein [Planctomycetota bacterium]